MRFKHRLALLAANWASESGTALFRTANCYSRQTHCVRAHTASDNRENTHIAGCSFAPDNLIWKLTHTNYSTTSTGVFCIHTYTCAHSYYHTPSRRDRNKRRANYCRNADAAASLSCTTHLLFSRFSWIHAAQLMANIKNISYHRWYTTTHHRLHFSLAHTGSDWVAANKA